MTSARRRPAAPSLARLSCAMVAVLTAGIAPAQQLSPEDAATLVLNAGRRAYNEQKFPAAAERFREFLKVAPNHKEAAAGRYGLGLALIESGDTKGALEALVPASTADFPDKPLALYQVGAVHRKLGAQAFAQIPAKPTEANALNTAATQEFTAAATAFASAAKLLESRAKNAEANANELSADGEWFVRARCDQAEMLLRLGKFTEAADAAWSVLVDPAWSKSRNRQLASYHLGHADFQLKDYAGAGRELSGLAPFDQEFGPHARYLLGRTYHLNNELPEAGAQYKAGLAGYEEQKKAAQEALKNPANLTSEQKAGYTALVTQPPPEYVARAIFYSAVLAFDEGRQGEAAEQFAAFAKNNPKSPLAPEAQVRAGACLVQLRKFPEAITALDPLKEHATLADQALTWLGRARSGGADPAKPAEYDAALNGALEALRKAAQRSTELAKTDADAKARRPGILMELADTAVLAKQYKEAVTNYELLISEKSPRAEEAMQRAVTAQHLAGLYAESDALALRFETAFPSSTLLPAVLFRTAEGAYLRALKAQANKYEHDRLLGVAIERYKRLVRKFPEFAYINQARQGLATAHYRLGNYTEAALIFATIPDAERTGELANVSYLLADCLIRTLPAESEDALQAERLIERAEQAAKLLEGFIGAQEKSPQAPDALLKLGHCYQRVGALMAAPAERTKLFTSARDAYDRAIKLTDKEPTRSAAVFERAKCLINLGDLGGAQTALTQFQNGPLNATQNATMALLRLSTLLRAQGKAAEAATMLAQCRTAHEAKLGLDPARKHWVPQLQYEHAIAMKEAGKLAESRVLFETIARNFAGQPEALNSQWRVGQCRREEGAAQLTAAREAVTKAGGKAELLAPAAKLLDTGIDAIRDAAESFQVEAEKLSNVPGATDAQTRMLYEGAWCHRLLADAENEAAKLKAQREKPGDPPPAPPEGLAPGEQRAVEFYRKILSTAPDAPVAAQARAELAELYSKHEQNDQAVDLLMDALEKSPATEVPERIRLGLAAAHLARKNPKQALACVQPLLANPASPNAAEARAVAAEALMQQQDWPKAIEQLVPFRDDQKLRSVANVSDRALLRLGHALAQAGQWDASRQTMEAVVQRYPQSPWVDEARYGIGWAWQNQKNFDQAVTSFAEVAKRTAAEVAAKAQLQIGLCRLDQKRFEEAETALLSVPLTYAYPEWSAAARCEAGRAQIELKKPDEAARNWQRVIKDYPKSQWAVVAQKNLAGIK